MNTSLQFHEQAEFLRESSGSTNIEKTLIKAVKALALFHIPHYVCGGFAVQEHGYPRFTVDVDIMVPDVQLAREKLYRRGLPDQQIRRRLQRPTAGSWLSPNNCTASQPKNEETLAGQVAHPIETPRLTLALKSH